MKDSHPCESLGGFCCPTSEETGLAIPAFLGSTLSSSLFPSVYHRTPTSPKEKGCWGGGCGGESQVTVSHQLDSLKTRLGLVSVG
ncbi:rCG61196 [Rattus norvegicus]|uniref:RCG61196 n=1 Tax=Rattus norvegicus TaxID=10116 RepID=A6KE19_RAT|nr:rCG61196 [Rattus norvegicus]